MAFLNKKLHCNLSFKRYEPYQIINIEVVKSTHFFTLFKGELKLDDFISYNKNYNQLNNQGEKSSSDKYIVNYEENHYINTIKVYISNLKYIEYSNLNNIIDKVINSTNNNFTKLKSEYILNKLGYVIYYKTNSISIIYEYVEGDIFNFNMLNSCKDLKVYNDNNHEFIVKLNFLTKLITIIKKLNEKKIYIGYICPGNLLYNPNSGFGFKIIEPYLYYLISPKNIIYKSLFGIMSKYEPYPNDLLSIFLISLTLFNNTNNSELKVSNLRKNTIEYITYTIYTQFNSNLGIASQSNSYIDNIINSIEDKKVVKLLKFCYESLKANAENIANENKNETLQYSTNERKRTYDANINSTIDIDINTAPKSYRKLSINTKDNETTIKQDENSSHNDSDKNSIDSDNVTITKIKTSLDKTSILNFISNILNDFNLVLKNNIYDRNCFYCNEKPTILGKVCNELLCDKHSISNIDDTIYETHICKNNCVYEVNKRIAQLKKYKNDLKTIENEEISNSRINKVEISKQFLVKYDLIQPLKKALDSVLLLKHRIILIQDIINDSLSYHNSHIKQIMSYKFKKIEETIFVRYKQNLIEEFKVEEEINSLYKNVCICKNFIEKINSENQIFIALQDISTVITEYSTKFTFFKQYIIKSMYEEIYNSVYCKIREDFNILQEINNNYNNNNKNFFTNSDNIIRLKTKITLPYLLPLHLKYNSDQLESNLIKSNILQYTDNINKDPLINFILNVDYENNKIYKYFTSFFKSTSLENYKNSEKILCKKSTNLNTAKFLQEEIHINALQLLYSRVLENPNYVESLVNEYNICSKNSYNVKSNNIINGKIVCSKLNNQDSLILDTSSISNNNRSSIKSINTKKLSANKNDFNLNYNNTLESIIENNQESELNNSKSNDSYSEDVSDNIIKTNISILKNGFKKDVLNTNIFDIMDSQFNINRDSKFVQYLNSYIIIVGGKSITKEYEINNINETNTTTLNNNIKSNNLNSTENNIIKIDNNNNNNNNNKCLTVDKDIKDKNTNIKDNKFIINEEIQINKTNNLNKKSVISKIETSKHTILVDCENKISYKMSDMLCNRSQHSIAIYNKIYLISLGGVLSKDCEIFDILTNIWTKLPSLDREVTNATLYVSNTSDTLYIFGGKYKNYNNLICYKFNTILIYKLNLRNPIKWEFDEFILKNYKTDYLSKNIIDYSYMGIIDLKILKDNYYSVKNASINLNTSNTIYLDDILNIKNVQDEQIFLMGGINNFDNQYSNNVLLVNITNKTITLVDNILSFKSKFNNSKFNLISRKTNNTKDELLNNVVYGNIGELDNKNYKLVTFTLERRII